MSQFSLFLFQLKETCFIQQEQLEKSKEEIEKEREALKSCQDELNRKLHEVCMYYVSCVCTVCVMYVLCHYSTHVE